MAWTNQKSIVGDSWGVMSPFPRWVNDTPQKSSYQVNGAGQRVDAFGNVAKPQVGWLDQLINDTKSQYQEAKKANEDRYNQGMGLLGMGAGGSSDLGIGSGVNVQAPTPNSYLPPPNLAGKMTEPGAMALQNGIDNGTYGSGQNTALSNKVALTNSIALRDQDRADRNLALQAQGQNYGQQLQSAQFDYNKASDANARTDALRNQRLAWIEGRNDTYPNMDLVSILAGQLGKADQAGMQDFSPMMGGGGGGAWLDPSSIGFNIPGGSWGTPQGYSYGQGGGGQPAAQPRQQQGKSPDYSGLINGVKSAANKVGGWWDSLSSGSGNKAENVIGNTFGGIGQGVAGMSNWLGNLYK